MTKRRDPLTRASSSRHPVTPSDSETTAPNSQRTNLQSRVSRDSAAEELRDSLTFNSTDEHPAAGGRATTVRAMVAALPLPTDRATLTVSHGVNAGQLFAIDKDVSVLGRDPDVDFFVDDAAISRKHCRFRRTDERYFVEDLGSANGTFLGGRKLREQQLGELFTGDRLQLGPDIVVRFSLSDRIEEQMQRRMYESATRDALTQAWSKAYLLERLVIEVASARRHKAELSLLVFEVDRFQELSGAAGPSQGARLLQAIAARIQRMLRVEDVLGRFGAERFAVLVRACDRESAAAQAERLRIAVAELSVPTPKNNVTTTVSIGVASLAELGPNEDEGELVSRGEMRLSQAKAAGGNRVAAGPRRRP